MSPAPLAEGYRETPLWWDDVHWPKLEPGLLPKEVDAVIVGGGFTGLSAARELARRGLSALVLEKESLGLGASGRNGGMVHAGVHFGPEELERRYGPAGLALHLATEEAFRHTRALVASEKIDCHLQACGWLYLAHRSSRLSGLVEKAHVHRNRLRVKARLLTADELPEETSARGFYGGLVSDHGAGIHPARYLAGLARAALKAGASVHEHTPCIGVERRQNGFEVATSAGAVRARDVLVATNGYTDAAFPKLQRRVVPIGSYIIATEPLAPELAAVVNPKLRMITDTRELLHYWRLSPDRRMLFGGRASFTDVTVAQARDILHASLVEIHPELGEVRVSHAWTGKVGFTFDRVPHFGRLDGITYAMGYCGSGVALSTWFGARAAAWIAGEDPPAFANLRFPTLPGYRGTPWFLPLAGFYYQLADRYL